MRRTWILLLNLLMVFWCCECTGIIRCALAGSEDPAKEQPRPALQYHTMLAGEENEAYFLGHVIRIPAINRSNLTSITLGGTILSPQQDGSPGTPAFALYFRRVNESFRTRDVVSLFYNELEYDRKFDHLELVGHFENYTLPTGVAEIQDNEEIKATSLTWGNLMASLGPGLRFEVPPNQIDNDLRLQLLGRVGYIYAQRNHDTGAGVVEPPSTLLYGARVRGRYDGLSRNLLELPHRGLAVGFDVDYLYRNNWRDLSPTGTGSVHRDYLQAKGYIFGVAGIPGLSERNSVLMRVNGGTTSRRSADRFNAFIINGGPFPSEQDDLIRPYYTGILYDDVRVINYATAAVGYRRELTFFLYLSLIGSYMWGDRASVQGADNVVFRQKTGTSGTVSLDSAFLWNSSLYFAYTWESGFIRNGRSGHGFMVTWNKLF